MGEALSASQGSKSITPKTSGRRNGLGRAQGRCSEMDREEVPVQENLPKAAAKRKGVQDFEARLEYARCSDLTNVWSRDAGLVVRPSAQVPLLSKSEA